MADLFSMKNRVVLLTGASRGLGRDMALTLAGAGATVLCAGRTVKELEATARAIIRKGGKAHVVPLDITDEAAVREQVETIVRKHRRIDVLVNNAGIIYRSAIVDTPTETFRKTVETDLVAQFVMSREVGRHMLARERGRIVNISSVMAILGRASVAGYVAAKHGVVGLTKTLAAEFGPHITVNAIAPGYIRTELNVALQKNKEFNDMLEQRTASRRWGRAGRPARRPVAPFFRCRRLHHRSHAGGRWRPDHHSRLTMTGIPRWVILLLGAGLVLYGVAVSQGWLRDPSLARADYIGTTDVSADDAKLYRAVPFEWRVTSAAGSFKGNDTAHVRIDGSGERTILCGWIRLDKAGASIRATRWLSEARLVVGDLKVTALFIAPVEKTPGDGLNAGCLRLDEGIRPASDAALSLEGPPVRE